MKFDIIKPEIIQSAMMNNLEMVKQFVDMYLQQCPIDFAKLKTGIQSENYQEIADFAHYIKPTMEYIGATELRLYFQELERLAKDKGSIEVITEKFQVLEEKFDQLLAELSLFYKSMP